MATDAPSILEKEKHIKYWKRCYSSFLPTPYTASDSTRLTFACFVVSALDLLSVPFTSDDRTAIRRWVLSLQHPDGGFCGSSTHTPPASKNNAATDASTANVAATFFALVLLGIAADGEDEDDMRRAYAGVDRVKLLRWLRKLQRQDGSFGQNLWEGKPAGGKDTRHSYLASCVRWMVRGDASEGQDGWVEDINVDLMIEHLRRGQTYDGGVGESSVNESHAGYAYCTVGALSLLDRAQDATATQAGDALKRGIPDREGILGFLAHRNFAYLVKEEEEDDVEENFIESKLGDVELEFGHVGYNGRWNKKADTCYCWWAAGMLAMLGQSSFINAPPSRRYILDITQHRIGGFSKAVGGPPDLYHSYLGLAALAVMGETDLKDFDAGLCCSKETTRKIERARDGLLAAGKGQNKSWDQDGFW